MKNFNLINGQDDSEEFLADNDWRVDDVISFDLQEDKSIILKNKTREQRNESLSKQIPLPLDQPLQDSWKGFLLAWDWLRWTTHRQAQ